MDHTDHVNLIRNGVVDGIWADFGSGTGAFTLALADLLPAGSTIFSIDRDANALDQQRRIMRERFPNQNVSYQTADFTAPLNLPPLDGILMANSLHFIRDKDAVLKQIHGYLKPDGRLLIVEYNTDHGNTWVPYPFSFATWQKLAAKNGFRDTRLLAARPSRFLSEIYSAVSRR